MNDVDLMEFSSETSAVCMGLDHSCSKEAEMLANELSFLSRNVQTRLRYYYMLSIECEQMFENKLIRFEKRRDEIGEKLLKTATEDSSDNEIGSSRFLGQQRTFYQKYDIQESAIAIGTFLKTYALFEDVLNQICITYGKLKSSDYKYADMKGGGIVRASKYMKKITGKDVQKHDEWKFVKSWNKIRNQIMHEDAKVNNNERIKAAMSELGINSYRDLTLNGAMIIDIKLTHVKEFIVLIDKVLSYFVLHEDNWK